MRGRGVSTAANAEWLRHDGDGSDRQSDVGEDPVIPRQATQKPTLPAAVATPSPARPVSAEALTAARVRQGKSAQRSTA
jgi:hypothetical protein